MATGKTYDPLIGFKVVSEMWEKRLNGLLYKMTDNREFVQAASMGLETYSRSLELLRKNQQLMAAFWNIPTKKDVANVAKLSVQAEEKIDLLEEQIWNLQDSLKSIQSENIEMFQEITDIVKEMQKEYKKMTSQMIEKQDVKKELQDLRTELISMRKLIDREKPKSKKETEKKQNEDLVLTGSGTSN